MSFATAKDLQASKKTTLIRLTHKKDLAGLYTLVAGPNYTFEAEHPIKPYAVKYSSTTGSGDEQDVTSYSWDKDTKVLTFQTIDAPVGINFVVVYSYVHITDGFSKYLDRDDPTGAITNVVEWEPRLLNKISMSQNISNIFDFKLSITSSSFTVDNRDNFLNDLVTVKDTFFNQDVAVWFGIDDNYIEIFNGTVGSLSIKRNATFNIKDGLKKLQSKAFLGDRNFQDNPYHSGIQYYDVNEIWNNAGQYRGYAPNQSDLTIGKLATQSETGGFINSNFQIGRYDIEPETGAKLISAVFAFTETINGQSFDRVYSDDIEALSLGSLIRGTSKSGAITLYKPIADIRYLNSGGYAGYFRVVATGVSTTDINWGVSNYRTHPIAMFYSSTNGSYVEAVDYSTISSFSVTQPTGNDNYLMSVIIKTSVSSPETADPNTLYYCPLPNIYPDTTTFDKIHGNLIAFLAEKAGVSVDYTTVLAANTAYNDLCRVRIPDNTGGEPRTYLEYIQDIAAASFGFVSYNASGELVYKLVEVVTSGDRDINETDIIEGSLETKVQWQDTKSEYKIVNEGPFDYQENQQYTISSKSWADRALSLYGYNYSNEIVYNGIMSQNHYNGLSVQKWQTRISLRLNLSSYPNIIYKFATSHKFMDIEIGDTINLITEEVKDGSVPLLVTGYTKGLDKVSITATKLGYS